jgi:hypothetical protein
MVSPIFVGASVVGAPVGEDVVGVTVGAMVSPTFVGACVVGAPVGDDVVGIDAVGAPVVGEDPVDVSVAPHVTSSEAHSSIV